MSMLKELAQIVPMPHFRTILESEYKIDIETDTVFGSQTRCNAIVTPEFGPLKKFTSSGSSLDDALFNCLWIIHEYYGSESQSHKERVKELQSHSDDCEIEM